MRAGTHIVGDVAEAMDAIAGPASADGRLDGGPTPARGGRRARERSRGEWRQHPRRRRRGRRRPSAARECLRAARSRRRRARLRRPSSAASAAGSASGLKRAWSTPCGMTATSAAGSSSSTSRSAVAWLTQMTTIGIGGGAADRLPEKGHLGPLVPFGMVEEGEVVDGHDRCDAAGVAREGVVRTVVDRQPRLRQPCERRTEQPPLVGEPGRPAGPHRVDQAVRPERAPAGRVVTTGHDREREFGLGGKRPGQLEHIAPGAGGLGRDGAHVEADRERHQRDRSSLHQARCRLAVSAQLSPAA